jgi:hypothetical protein
MDRQRPVTILQLTYPARTGAARSFWQSLDIQTIHSSRFPQRFEEKVSDLIGIVV